MATTELLTVVTIDASQLIKNGHCVDKVSGNYKSRNHVETKLHESNNN